MSEPLPEHITVNFDLTAADYERYAEAIERRGRRWLPFNVFVVVVFCAIPTAFLFRWLAAERLHNPEAIDIVGKYSLFSFGVAIIACWISSFLIQRIGRRRYYQSIADWHEEHVAEFDHAGITVIRKGTRATYEWTIVPRCTLERNLLLIWISPLTAAVAIPSRCFGNDAACTVAMAFVRARLSEVQAPSAQTEAAKPPTRAS